jgi:hypothetical protein
MICVRPTRLTNVAQNPRPVLGVKVCFCAVGGPVTAVTTSAP